MSHTIKETKTQESMLYNILLMKNENMAACLRGIIGMAEVEIQNGSNAWKGAKELIDKTLKENEV